MNGPTDITFDFAATMRNNLFIFIRVLNHSIHVRAIFSLSLLMMLLRETMHSIQYARQLQINWVIDSCYSESCEYFAFVNYETVPTIYYKISFTFVLFIFMERGSHRWIDGISFPITSRSPLFFDSIQPVFSHKSIAHSKWSIWMIANAVLGLDKYINFDTR